MNLFVTPVPLTLIRGLMTEPNVLFLDEPTLGVDLQNRAKIWEYLQSLKDKQGLTLLLTTHDMDEAKLLADKVGIIDHGKIIVEGNPDDLIHQMGTDRISVRGTGVTNKFIDAISKLPFVQNVITANGLIQIGVDSGKKRLAEVVTYANNVDFKIHDLTVAQPSLGDVFLKYTGHQLRDI